MGKVLKMHPAAGFWHTHAPSWEKDLLVPASNEHLLAIQGKVAVRCHGHKVLIGAGEVPRALQEGSRGVVKHLQSNCRCSACCP